MGFLEKIFGTYSEREVKKLQLIADKIEALDDSMQSLSDEQLQAKTIEFKDRISKGESLDSLLPEAFAVCREASLYSKMLLQVEYLERSILEYNYLEVWFYIKEELQKWKLGKVKL